MSRHFYGLAAAIRFLLPVGRRDYEIDGCRDAPVWFVPIGLLIGLAWAGIFKAVWRYREEMIVIRVMPAWVVLLLECLITGAFLVLGLARTVNSLSTPHRERSAIDRAAPLSPLGTLILGLAVLSLWVLISSMPTASGWWPDTGDWRYRFRRLYPAYVYRPLILAPVWGRWAILLASTIGRTAKQSDRQTLELCRAMRPGRLLRHSIVPFVLTSIYLSREGNYVTGLMVGLLVFGIAYVASVVAARRGGGQTRESLYAIGEIGQLAFLALYRAFWPLIHG